jgi:pyruvate-formate lyase-activating enzyme
MYSGVPSHVDLCWAEQIQFIQYGPGIRSVVFFKGCPLDCVWCQNPESKKATVELSWDRERCVGCGHCIRRGRRSLRVRENRQGGEFFYFPINWCLISYVR